MALNNLSKELGPRFFVHLPRHDYLIKPPNRTRLRTSSTMILRVEKYSSLQMAAIEHPSHAQRTTEHFAPALRQRRSTPVQI